MRRAHRSRSDQDLHAWRRRAKDLYYVIELGGAPKGLVKKFQWLAQLLGDDHDLALFLAHHESTTGPNAQARLRQRAKKRRRPLQKEAFRLGAKLFHDGAGAFVRQMMP
jgi:hypothetical protein